MSFYFVYRKLKRDSIPKLPPALDETDILLIQKEEEVSLILIFKQQTYCLRVVNW